MKQLLGLGLFDPKMQALKSFKMSGTTQPVTQWHIPEDVNPLVEYFCTKYWTFLQHTSKIT